MGWISRSGGVKKTLILKVRQIQNGLQIALVLYVQTAWIQCLFSSTLTLPLGDRSGKPVFSKNRNVWVGSIHQNYMQPGSDGMDRRILVLVIDLVCGNGN